MSANAEQRRLLAELAQLRDHGGADHARALVLRLSGWCSAHIAEAFGVHTPRLCRPPSSWGTAQGDFSRCSAPSRDGRDSGAVTPRAEGSVAGGAVFGGDVSAGVIRRRGC